jgi:hypothetical protein
VHAPEAGGRRLVVSHLDEHARRGEPRLEVVGVDRTEPDDDVRLAGAVAAPAAAGGDGVEIRFGVGEQPLRLRNLGELEL